MMERNVVRPQGQMSQWGCGKVSSHRPELKSQDLYHRGHGGTRGKSFGVPVIYQDVVPTGSRCVRAILAQAFETPAPSPRTRRNGHPLCWWCQRDQKPGPPGSLKPGSLKLGSLGNQIRAGNVLVQGGKNCAVGGGEFAQVAVGNLPGSANPRGKIRDIVMVWNEGESGVSCPLQAQ
jgi:hypothetical protein